MPILRREPDIFPKDLLSASAGAASEERRWWLVYTKARQEKALARELWERRVPYYLPLIPRDQIISGRRRRSFIPLFSGYVFLFASSGEQARIWLTHRVSTILPVEGGDALRSELRQVQRLIASDAPLSVERRLTPGHRVRIKSGPMAGFEGVVIERRGKTRLLVAVRLLQQGVSVDIDDCVLERI